MPYTLDWYRYGVHKKFVGPVTMAELLQSLSKVQCHPNYGSFEFTITDFLEAESIEFNESDMMLYGAHAIGGEFVNRKLVVGIVVTDPEVIALLKLRYEPLVHYSVGYFPTLKECKSWIEEKSPTVSLFSRSGN